MLLKHGFKELEGHMFMWVTYGDGEAYVPISKDYHIYDYSKLLIKSVKRCKDTEKIYRFICELNEFTYFYINFNGIFTPFNPEQIKDVWEEA